LALLLIRISTGISVFILGRLFLSNSESSAALVIGVFSLLGGVFLFAGFLTPLASLAACLSGAFEIYFWRTHAPADFSVNETIALYSIIIGAALALLGPGALSLDAFLFGRREIIIPKNQGAVNQKN
jgi:uncharacterized membrane protein YphA (DoxX/SURF4 family)